MKLTREKILQCLLNTLVESKYLNYFPTKTMQHYSGMGYVATTNPDSNIRILLEVQAHALIDQLGEYEILPPKKLTRVEKRAIEKAKKAQLIEDQKRFNELEKAWKEDEPRAHQEMLDNAQKAAENILAKQKTLKER